jgi:hypothetical protein
MNMIDFADKPKKRFFVYLRKDTILIWLPCTNAILVLKNKKSWDETARHQQLLEEYDLSETLPLDLQETH